MRVNFKLKMLAMAIPLLTLIACKENHRIEGNNHPTKEKRSISGYDQVNLSDDFQVEIVRDSIYSVTIDAEENLMPYIETETGGGVLHLGIEEHHNIRPHYPIKVKVGMPELTGVRISGSGIITCDTFNTSQIVAEISGSGTINLGIHATKVIANISGSGDINLAGTSNEADMTISGSENIRALPLQTTNCTADISGSGNIYVSVSSALNVHISGSGNVYYSGNPAIDAHISGSGKIIHY